ncbi:MAG: EFR1 family ferrodoxin [Anaeroplasmataceae bacterium]
MIGVYFSGTGNTKFCVEELCKSIDEGIKIYALEDADIINKILESEEIIFGYPTQFSNIPYMVREFIVSNKTIWKNKKIICLSTMGLFSGDAAGCSARLFKKFGAKILGGIHIKMPDSVCDNKALKHTLEENIKIVNDAKKKIHKLANKIKNNKYPHDGCIWYHHIAGLFGQRLWFYGKTNKYSKKLKVDHNLCIKCGKCINNCPMNNLYFKDNKVESYNKCTMCYRCVSKCPNKAITILGKEVIEQVSIEKYLK